ncbi:uncharacterized protein [Linepithema humile]|uniref:uncharacterized protein n=1 Tax=Linepithema humile TaxID=83485 RepID=UPI00351E1FF7
MNNTSNNFRMPYLQAIQSVPGNTASEKLKWIGKLASHCEDVIGSLDKLFPILLPILQVETAIKRKRHKDITSALKSDDSTIVRRALKASWFFDGGHEIVDVEYFCERIFPFVSLHTKTRIVKTLARRMKNPVFAQKMFTAVASAYDVETASPLIMACDQDFIYKTIMNKKLKLSIKILKRIFRKYPDFGIFLFKESIYSPESFASCHEQIDEGDQYNIIDKYENFIPTLIKKRPLSFIKMIEEFSFWPLTYMSNKCAKKLLNAAYTQQFVLPHLSILCNNMSKKIIDTRILTEDMFRKEMRPCTKENFYSDGMIYYLNKFPEEKRLDLLCKTYNDIFQQDFLEDISNVSDEVLQLLPVKQRIEYARRFMNIEPSDDALNFRSAWICYFPVKKAISVIKFRFSRAQLWEDKLGYLLQMIFTCIVNKDDSALTYTLTFVKDKYYPQYERKCLAVFLDVIEKKYYTGNWQQELQLEVRKEKKKKLKRLVANKKKEQGETSLNEEEEEFEEALQGMGKKTKKIFLYQLIVAMYDFNLKCKKMGIDEELMTIKDYPWLMNAIRVIMRKTDFILQKKMHILLYKYEPELYRSWFLSTTSKNIADVTSGAALLLLKKDFQSVLNNWEEYLSDCKIHYYHKNVQRFVRATRWYKDIPVKFAERCIEDLHGKDEREMSSALIILSLLLQDNSLEKLICPFIPAVETVMNSYRLVRGLDFAMRFSNPSLPLKPIGELCKGNHLSIVLMTLTSVIRRSSSKEVMSFATEVESLNVNVQKHWIKLMYSTASIHDLTIFLYKVWQTEKHHSIRKLLFIMIQKLFRTKPHPKTFSLCHTIMSTLTVEDEKLLRMEELSPDFIPDKYFVVYYDQWFKTIENLSASGLKTEIVKQHIEIGLAHLLLYIDNPLSRDDINEIFLMLLFCNNITISKATCHFLVWFCLNFYDYAYFNLIDDIFSFYVKKNRYKFHHNNADFYLTNLVVHRFVNEFIISYVKLRDNKYYDVQLIHQTYEAYLSVLSPAQNANTYLLLRYAMTLQEFYRCSYGFQTEFSFGKKLGEIMNELVDIFTLYLIPFMSEVLQYFLNYVFDTNCRQATKNVIQGLISADNMYSSFMAITILSAQKRGNDRFMGVLNERFLSYSASSIVFNHCRNSINFIDVDFDEFGGQ